ncbi:MAG: YdeI/OmpD-associated family protein [Gemmatimonadetes bacterium]|nr:YdeI/OmpD-associated family protein [Gemmatimonadota bacterium]
MKPMFFEDSAALRAWLDAHHASEDVLWVGLHKKGSGLASITWPELVDEVLCFGWIDGIRKSVDEDSYMIRITPRRRRSNWSDVNIRRIGELIDLGLVQPAGLVAFRRWESSATGQAAEARRAAATDWESAGAGESGSAEEFGPDFERRFRVRSDAWEFFQAQPAGYRRTATRWVMSAKQEETRVRRLETLIADSAAGRRIKELRRQGP